MTTSLDAHYVELLRVGFVVLKQAIESGDGDWVAAEIEMLHNVPSLIGEQNVHRHRYYWSQERAHYLDWVSAPGRERCKSRMRTYFEPIWNEMEQLVPLEASQPTNVTGS